MESKQNRNESISGFVSANESECCDFLCKGQRTFHDTYNDIADGLAKQALGIGTCQYTDANPYELL